MREYDYRATDETIEALRRLRRAWAGYHLTGDALVVVLEEGGTVRISVEGAELEPALAAFRLSAAPTESDPAHLSPPESFGAGGNDVVVFRSETWIEAGAPGSGADATTAVMQFTGSPLQRPPSAAAVCSVDDAVVVASSAGTGLLVRCGLRPYALEVERDPTAIARFLVARQYGGAPDEG